MQTHRFYNDERAKEPSFSPCLPSKNSKTKFSLKNKYQEGADRCTVSLTLRSMFLPFSNRRPRLQLGIQAC